MKRVALIHHNVSGSNTYIMAGMLPEWVTNRFEVNAFRFELKYGWGHRRWDFWYELYPEEVQWLWEADALLGTHGTWRARKGQVAIETWHGFPLKGMVNMDWGEDPEDRELLLSRWREEVDLVLSYSRLYTTLMAACMGIPIERFVVTGMPRNDLLFYQDEARQRLVSLFPLAGEAEGVLLYVPTFRVGREDKVEGETSRRLDLEELEVFLDGASLYMVIKFHPFEEEIMAKMYDLESFEHIGILREGDLEARNWDVYHILGGFDLLITDYSSIYFDFLLTDKPIVFYPTDIDEYRRRRGFLLEPYSFWTPGPKAYNQVQLEVQIQRLMEDPSLYARQRETIRRLVHYHRDPHSTDRVWTLVEAAVHKGVGWVLEQNRKSGGLLFRS